MFSLVSASSILLTMTDEVITAWADAMYLDKSGLALGVLNATGGFQMDRRDVVKLLQFLRDTEPSTEAFKGFVASLYGID